MNGGSLRTVVGWWSWRDNTHGSKTAAHWLSVSMLPSARHSHLLAREYRITSKWRKGLLTLEADVDAPNDFQANGSRLMASLRAVTYLRRADMLCHPPKYSAFLLVFLAPCCHANARRCLTRREPLPILTGRDFQEAHERRRHLLFAAVAALY